MPEEIWKDIPGYEGAYQASSLGRIRSVDHVTVQKLPRGVCSGVKHKGRVLTQRRHNNTRVPYLVVDLKFRGKHERLLVHTLVAAAFLGERPVGYEVRHLDNDPQNNRATNLAYGTHVENMADTVSAGRHCHKLTPEQVAEIRVRISSGETNTHICIDYGVSDVVISNIRLGRSYGYWQ